MRQLKISKQITNRDIDRTNPDEVITLMVGRELDQIFPPRARTVGKDMLTVRDLHSPPEVKKASFTVKEGQIVGIYGLVGAGRTELAKAIFGARPSTGEIYLEGKSIRFRHPQAAVKQGVALLTEDRKTEGLIMGLSVRKNMALASLDQRARGGVIKVAAEKSAVNRIVDRLNIRTTSIEKDVFYLSGGNQQKVSLAKSLDSQPEIFIFDEPTRGIDIKAKMHIFSFVHDLVESGISCIFISSELEEVIGVCNRVIVMREGRIAGDLTGSDINEEEIMQRATGVKQGVAA